MNSRCRPGDIAVFICGKNLGKLVHVDRAFIGEEEISGTLFRKTTTGPSWVVTSLGGLLFNLMEDGGTTKGQLVAPFNGQALRPIRNKKGKDQSLRRNVNSGNFKTSWT
jgi:hypothetical protein